MGAITKRVRSRSGPNKNGSKSKFIEPSIAVLLSAMKVFALALAALYSVAASAAPLSDSQKADIDRAVAKVLAATQVPSASIGVVVDSGVAYCKAYGNQRLDGSPATETARYPVASISKQFTAAALLLLEADGKLSLSDKVSKYLPSLTESANVTIAQLLGHTSGYRDFWPQDYDFAAMKKPVSAEGILDRWARVPLDYAPGGKWQYSNTGYTAAGRIAEIVAGEPLFAFEQRRIFKPLGMNVIETEIGMTKADAVGTDRKALGPVRPVPSTARGWLFAAGDLAMSPCELSKWNIARLNRVLLPTAQWDKQETSVAPADAPEKYGLGVGLDVVDGHARVEHNGALSGFLSSNRVYPADKVAITVLTSAGFSNAQDAIADAIAQLLLANSDETAFVRKLFISLSRGEIDRSRFTVNGNDYFDAQTLADYAKSLAPLGEPDRVVRRGAKGLRGGLTVERFLFHFNQRKLLIVLRAEPGSQRVEQFAVYPFSD
jgi:D-alanyl-D-alanine carboxypeptidase